jgi:hypothetical protein
MSKSCWRRMVMEGLSYRWITTEFHDLEDELSKTGRLVEGKCYVENSDIMLRVLRSLELAFRTGFWTFLDYMISVLCG